VTNSLDTSEQPAGRTSTRGERLSAPWRASDVLTRFEPATLCATCSAPGRVWACLLRPRKNVCYGLPMETGVFWDLGSVSDAQLRSGLTSLLASGYRTEARFARTDKPRKPRKPGGIKLRRRGSHREHIPNAVQRLVATRDGLRCTYVSEVGCLCSSRAFLQIHHEEAWASGGASIPENLRLLCAVHNRLLAERDFGSAHVAERLAARRGRDARATEAEAATRSVGHEVSTGRIALPGPE
jgi:5-methylcytosine-specific restriction endonuclease McrA